MKKKGILLFSVDAKEYCMNCGSCVSACSPCALSMGAPDWMLRFEPEKCIACGFCSKACPLGLLKVELAG